MSLWRKLNDDPTLLDFASNFLRSSSTGVDRLEIMKSEISQRRTTAISLVNRWQFELVQDAESGRRRFIEAPRACWRCMD